MKKSNAIDLKKKTEIAIKEGIKNGKIRRVEPEKVTSFLDFVLPITTERKDESKKEENESDPSWLSVPILSSSMDFDIRSFFTRDWNDISNRQIFQQPGLLQVALESKINQTHEELATQRKYARGLEKMIVNQNRTIVDLIHEKNKIKKQFSDFKDEFNEYLQKYGEAILFIKDEMNRIRRERQKTTQFDETSI